MTKINKTPVKAEVPAKLAELIDIAAARQLVSRASWVRSAILDRAVRDGLVKVDGVPKLAARDAEINRLFS